MWKEYKETFDSVHASQRLKTEVLNMNRKEHITKKRRIPAAVLAAAILAAALAGTAAAYLSRVTVAPCGDGYSVQSEAGNVPLASLSEDVLQYAANMTGRMDILPFQSWDEAEDYLGLEIADNARLDRMEKGLWGMSLSDRSEPVIAPCILDLRSNNGLPDTITLTASYIEGDLSVKEEAVLIVEDPTFDADRSYSFANPITELKGTEVYVTPSGIEAAIVTSRAVYREDFIRIEYQAQFILHRASCSVRISAAEEDSGEAALSLMKEILDAYE